MFGFDLVDKGTKNKTLIDYLGWKKERIFVLSHANLVFLFSIIKDMKEYVLILYDNF